MQFVGFVNNMYVQFFSLFDLQGNEVDPNVKQSRSATVGPSRPASAARVTPRPTRATAPVSIQILYNIFYFVTY